MPDAELLAQLNAHLPIPLPPFSEGGAVPSATLVRGEAVATFSLGPGSRLLFISDPYSTGLGWATVVGPTGPVPNKTGFFSPVTTEYGDGSLVAFGSMCLSNTRVLPWIDANGQVNNLATWNLVPFQTDPYNIVGSVPSNAVKSTYAGGDDSGFNMQDPFAANSALVSFQRGSVSMEVQPSWNAFGRVFNCGLNTNAQCFGPGTGYTTTNDDNPVDSNLVCNNQLLLGNNLTFGANAGSFPFGNIDDALDGLIVPELIAGGSSALHTHTQLGMMSRDRWFRAGSSKVGNTLPQYFLDNDGEMVSTNSRGVPTIQSNLAETAPCFPAFAFFEEIERAGSTTQAYQSGFMDTSTQPIIDAALRGQLDEITARQGFTYTSIGQRACSVHQVRNDSTEGVIVVRISGSITAGMVQQPRGPLAVFNRVITPYKSTIPRTIGGHTGTSTTSATQARTQAVSAAQAGAQQQGFKPQSPSFWDSAKKVASMATSSGVASGLTAMAEGAAVGLANLTPAGPIADAAAVLGPIVASAVMKIPAVKRIEGAVVDDVERAGSWAWDTLRSIF